MLLDPTYRKRLYSWLMSPFGGPTTATRIRVNAETAMRRTAVYSAVRILAETVATLPLIVYENREDIVVGQAIDMMAVSERLLWPYRALGMD